MLILGTKMAHLSHFGNNSKFSENSKTVTFNHFVMPTTVLFQEEISGCAAHLLCSVVYICDSIEIRGLGCARFERISRYFREEHVLKFI